MMQMQPFWSEMSYGLMRVKKMNTSWMWIALCRKTRQVVSSAIGDRSKETGQKLWNKIPLAYHGGKCFTDFYGVYKSIIPQDQHYPVGKQTGETAHVERWNTTVRQRLGRFVRETLSFSKSGIMHEICLRLFLHRYNTEKALAFMETIVG